MRIIRNGIDLVCSCVMVGCLYGFPIIAGGMSQFMGGDELATEADRAPHYETLMIDTPIFTPEGDHGEDTVAEESDAPKPEPKKAAVPPPATKATIDEEALADTELVDVAIPVDEPTTTASASRTKRGDKCLPDNEGIVQVDDSTWNIKGDIVDFYVKHINQAQKLASVSWNRAEDGDVDGFKVRRMRCGNVLRQAGLQNGDVIQSINGKFVHNIPTAIAAYTKLRSKNVLRLTVERDGEILHIRYKLV